MSCMIWYQLYNLKNVKSTHGGVLILVKLLAEACDFTKINTPPWVLFTFLKFYRMVSNCATHQICYFVWSALKHAGRTLMWFTWVHFLCGLHGILDKLILIQRKFWTIKENISKEKQLFENIKICFHWYKMRSPWYLTCLTWHSL